MIKRGLFGLKVYVFDNGEYEANQRITIISNSLSEAMPIWREDAGIENGWYEMFRNDRHIRIKHLYETWTVFISPFHINVAY